MEDANKENKAKQQNWYEVFSYLGKHLGYVVAQNKKDAGNIAVEKFGNGVFTKRCYNGGVRG